MTAPSSWSRNPSVQRLGVWGLGLGFGFSVWGVDFGFRPLCNWLSCSCRIKAALPRFSSWPKLMQDATITEALSYQAFGHSALPPCKMSNWYTHQFITHTHLRVRWTAALSNSAELSIATSHGSHLLLRTTTSRFRKGWYSKKGSSPEMLPDRRRRSVRPLLCRRSS